MLSRLGQRAALALVTVGASLQVAAQPAPAAPAPKPWYEQIAFNAFVSAGYSYNFNKPDSGTNTLRVFDFDDNTMKLDVAEIVVQKAVASPNDVGFKIDFMAGASIPRVTASAGLFRDGNGVAQDVDIKQAFVSWIAPVGRGLRFDVGKFVTHHGVEVIEGYDGYNDNYTRGLLFGYAIPFAHTGIKATLPLSDTVSAMLMIANGWDNVKDNNSGKSIGAQLVVNPSSKVSLLFNYCGGPELANSNDLRHLIDVIAVLKPTDKLTFTLNYDYATEQGTGASPNKDARWQGIAGYARIGLTDTFALCLRGERFDDRDGVRTGTQQKVTEFTVTPEVRISEKLVVRADLRFDSSDKDVFVDGSKPKGNQTTLAFNTLYSF